MFTAKAYVTLKDAVLDPQGNAVRSALHSLGFAEIEDLRIGKYMEVAVALKDEKAAHSRVDAMCQRLLANPVIENYRFELVEEKQ